MFNKNKIEIIIVLDNIRSMHNIGSIFRTCDAIGDCKIYLCGICATPPEKEIHKTALGATEYVEWKYFKTTKEALNNLLEIGYSLIAVEQTKHSIDLKKFKINNRKIALIFGNEVKGVSQDVLEISEKHIEIPQRGIKKSMNVAVAAGIVIWKLANN